MNRSQALQVQRVSSLVNFAIFANTMKFIPPNSFTKINITTFQINFLLVFELFIFEKKKLDIATIFATTITMRTNFGKEMLKA